MAEVSSPRTWGVNRIALCARQGSAERDRPHASGGEPVMAVVSSLPNDAFAVVVQAIIVLTHVGVNRRMASKVGAPLDTSSPRTWGEPSTPGSLSHYTQ